MNEREYLEHLEAIGRYITSINKVEEFKDFIAQSRKRPNAYFGYAVGIPLNVDPSTADKFFKDLPYEQDECTTLWQANDPLCDALAVISVEVIDASTDIQNTVHNAWCFQDIDMI